MPGDTHTKEKLFASDIPRREGDEVTGVWICSKTEWRQIGDQWYYIRKGSRAKAVWKFTSTGVGRWRLTQIDTDTILEPSPPLWTRIKSWFGSNNLPPARTV